MDAFGAFCGKYYNNQYSHYKQTVDKYRLFDWAVNCSFYSFSVCVSCLIYIARIWSFFKNKTQNISIIRGFGVILNLLLNYILITYYQPLLGAAIATTISYFMMSFVIYSWNKSFFNFQYDWKIVFIITVYGWSMVIIQPCAYIIKSHFVNFIYFTIS